MKIKIFCLIFLILPSIALAKTNPNVRYKAMEKALKKARARREALYKKRKSAPQETSRQKIIDETLRNIAIEISLDYFLARGEQIFEVIDDAIGARISKLQYPQRGNMFIANAELRLHPRFSVGGSFGSSRFRHTISTDTDWWVWTPALIPPDLVWLESVSSCKSQVDNFSGSLYFRLLDMDKVSLSSDIKEYFLLKTLDRFALDIFTGYQQQRGRYRDTDGKWTVINWTPVYDNPIEGLDSFYKVTYQGPHLGLRTDALFNNWISTRLRFSYAWLTTKAYGWWNKRSLSFWQEGKRGRGLNFDLEILLHLTPHWYLGTGYKYTYYKQTKLKETGFYHDASNPNWNDLEIIKNVNNKLYGPIFKLGCIW